MDAVCAPPRTIRSLDGHRDDRPVGKDSRLTRSHVRVPIAQTADSGVGIQDEPVSRTSPSTEGHPFAGALLKEHAYGMGVYLAVGDSMSIDDYTGVDGGGAASQLARKLRLELVDLTADGNTTHDVLADLARAPAAADVVTLTAGGNDLLGGELPGAILGRLHQIAAADRAARRARRRQHRL